LREAKPLASVTRPIFAIFEGGGAKGVAHVGAIAAAEANGLTFVGVAGASAGAIVAALLAVGFKALELVDPTSPGADILSRSGVGPTDLLGRRPWRRFKRLLKGGGWLAPRVALGGVGLSFLTAPAKENDSARKTTERTPDYDCKIKAALCGWSVVAGRSKCGALWRAPA
jgi:hypothetical protein